MNYKCNYVFNRNGLPMVVNGFNHFIEIEFQHPMLTNANVIMSEVQRFVEDTMTCRRQAEEWLEDNKIHFVFFDGTTYRWSFLNKTDAMRFKLMMS